MFKTLINMILFMTIGFSGCGTVVFDSPEDNGGVRKYNDGADSPKIIESTEIESFECEFSLIAAVLEEQNELEGRVYTISAYLENGAVKCKCEWYDRFGNGDESEFTADTSFMKKLQEIVSKYNFAAHNGYSNRVSGLPDMYGSKLDITYKSGESIYAYDNQDCFISFEAISELVHLFSA